MDLICEETKHGLESIAETLANRERLRYRNIEVSLRRRAELGIPPSYTIDVLDSDFPAKDKAKWNAMLESHIVEELLGAITGARVVVVICGVRHMPVLVQTLQLKFNSVEPHDVTTMPWFDQSLL